MISLLLNTYSEQRHDSILRILRTQCKYDCLDEILLFNNSPKHIEFEHPKLKVISANYDVGLRSRWILGILAKHNCLFVQDDDLLIRENVFHTVYSHYLFDNDKLYGIFGRKVNVLGVYDTQALCRDNPDFILTRLACFDRRLIPYVLEAEEKMLPFRFPTPKEFPYDDLLLSYTARSLYDKFPNIVLVEKNDIEELEAGNGLHEAGDYMERRKEIIRICREKLLYETIQHPEPLA